ncbi:AraC family transcriptional regulator ligand-binding domain-containing protein [Aestuariivirga sp.]|uniref:AraC family transcriptional regulator n=1 Tax=Aestuariivirga sp. TaxID=2650926 RepID=UPI0035938359
MQRLGPGAGLPDFLARHGRSIDEVLHGLPVTASDLRPDAFMPLPLVIEIFERAAAATQCGDIGFQLGKQQSFPALGAVGQLMSYSQTLGEALADYITVQISNSSAGSAYLHRLGDDYAFGFGLYGPGFRSSAHIYDISLAVGINIIRDLTRGAVIPLEALLIRLVPDDPAPYREHARCPVRFNQNQCCLILSARDLDFPLKTYDREAHGKLLGALQARLKRDHSGVADQVRHAMRPLMLTGKTSLDDVAAHLGLHPRTLERRLDAWGTTFGAIKDSVRFAVARELLLITELSASDIAASLGYATPSAFVHAFRRWANVTPTHWRREARAQGAGSE